MTTYSQPHGDGPHRIERLVDTKLVENELLEP